VSATHSAWLAWFAEHGDRALYTLQDYELENSPLADLSSRCGYASLRRFLNDWEAWDRTISWAFDELTKQLEVAP
jgi:hypothetical protein